MPTAADTFKYIDPDQYQEHVDEERRVFNPDLYTPSLIEKTGAGLRYVLDAQQLRVERAVGRNVWDFTVALVNELGQEHGSARVLSLGSGPGGAEISLAGRFTVPYEFDCIDINEQSLQLGQARADEQGLRLHFQQQDINQIELAPNTYDVVFAHASLHHMVNHEYIAEQVRQALKAHGQFVVYDVTARNGLQMWDDTKEIANRLFRILAAPYRFDGERYLESLPEGEAVPQGFECIRSQDLYGVLVDQFQVRAEVPGFAFARRFVDHPFDDNYDAEGNPFDKAILDTLLRLDEEFSARYQLRPEAVFLVLTR